MRFPCRRVSPVLLGLSFCALKTASFVPTITNTHRLARTLSSTSSSSSDKQETDAERLMRRARELKAEAEAEARALHETRLTQKELRDQQIDSCVDSLFPPDDDGTVGALVERMKRLQYSTDKLLEIVERLHEREVKAKGLHHVEALFQHNTHTGFERVAEEDREELDRVNGLIDRLIEAAKQVDEEYMELKGKTKGPNYLSHVDIEHWTVGECATILSTKIRELRREHEKQFQERLHSFYEAQRKKDLPSPPEYMP